MYEQNHCIFFNNKFYEQKRWCQYGFTITTCIDQHNYDRTRKSIEDGTIKFNECFVDDTLAVIKPKEIACMDQTLNNFDLNFCFIINTFKNDSNKILNHLAKLAKLAKLAILYLFQARSSLKFRQL